MSTNMFLLLDLFQQYTEAVYTSPLFSMGDAGESAGNGNVSPTQTPPAPANRAEKRAAKKSGLILPDKKLVTP